jgi:hypothetical protein
LDRLPLRMHACTQHNGGESSQLLRMCIINIFLLYLFDVMDVNILSINLIKPKMFSHVRTAQFNIILSETVGRYREDES